MRVNLINNFMCVISRVVDGFYIVEVEREYTGCNVGRWYSWGYSFNMYFFKYCL